MANTTSESRVGIINQGVLCRLCLNHHEDSFNIFASSVTSRMELWDVMRDLLSLEVAKGDGLPDTMCCLCVSKLLEFSDFKLMCVKSATILKRSILEGVVKIRIKEEAHSSESMGEEAILGEDPSEDRSIKRDAYNEVFVPFEMENQNDVTGEVNPFESLAEVDPLCQEDFEMDDYLKKPVSNTPDVKEEVILSESQAEEVTYGGEDVNEGECEGAASYNVVCVPFEVENLVDSKQGVDQSAPVAEGGSIARENLVMEESSARVSFNEVYDSSIAGSILKVGENILDSLALNRIRNTAIEGRRKAGSNVNQCSTLLKNDSSEHSQPSESIAVVPGENFGVACSTLNGMNINEMKYKDGVLEVKENHSCNWREYICNDCGFKCSERTKLYMHITGHILKRTVVKERHEGDVSQKDISLKCKRSFKCEVCEMVYKRKVDLVNHSLMHNRRKQLYKCEICGKVFYWKCRLNRHSIIHTSLKPFKCETCGKKFNQSGSLVRHNRGHTGLKPITCEKCGKRYKRSDYLINHSCSHTKDCPL